MPDAGQGARQGAGQEANLSFEHAFEPGDRDRDEPSGGGFTLLLLHGTGADQHDLLPLGRALAPGAPMLSPLGKVREQGMPRWFERLEEGVFDEESIRERAAELAGFLDEAVEHYGLDPDRFVAIGFSNGANIAASLLLLHPASLAGAVLLRAMTPLKPDELPDLDGVPVYIASGEQDPLIPRADAEGLATMLEEAGADVTHRWAKAGHGLGEEEIPAIQAWLADRDAGLG